MCKIIHFIDDDEKRRFGAIEVSQQVIKYFNTNTVYFIYMLIVTSCLLSLTQTPVVTLNRTFYIFKMRINDLCNMFRIHFVIVFVWIFPSMVYAYGLQVHLCKAQVNGSNTVLCTTGTMYIVHTPLVCF